MTQSTIAAAVLVAVSAVPATAHTADQLEEWLTDWSNRADVALTLELVAEYADMTDRHSPNPTRRFRPAVEQWRSAVAAAFPPRLVDEALAVMECESGGNPDAKNRRSTAAGLFQFLRTTWNRVGHRWLGFGTYRSGAVYDGHANIAAAAALVAHYESNGWWRWSAWECQP